MNNPNHETACKQLRLSRLYRKYLKPDLLIVDDMGLKALPKHSGEYLLESEVAEIKTAARVSKKTKSQWVREVLLAAARASGPTS